ncbi:hypothetical protein KR52_06255 [Synechococcus sp. KORDI-52]|nr:hypothetical protein KR52_06255 [Synechococcus sp. KORDI-52]
MQILLKVLREIQVFCLEQMVTFTLMQLPKLLCKLIRLPLVVVERGVQPMFRQRM